MKIRAWAIKETGGPAEPFVYERTLGSHEVLVKITHRSPARGDIQFIDNAWGDTRFPLVPSHEIVGIVEEAGSKAADLHTGDRVRILMLVALVHKNPNEMDGRPLTYTAELDGNTLRMTIANPLFLPGLEWRLVLTRIE
jgi:NADPH:quinone reductase-like Zn-dependent oxidoreductase